MKFLRHTESFRCDWWFSLFYSFPLFSTLLMSSESTTGNMGWLVSHEWIFQIIINICETVVLKCHIKNVLTSGRYIWLWITTEIVDIYHVIKWFKKKVTRLPVWLSTLVQLTKVNSLFWSVKTRYFMKSWEWNWNVIAAMT